MSSPQHTPSRRRRNLSSLIVVAMGLFVASCYVYVNFTGQFGLGLSHGFYDYSTFHYGWPLVYCREDICEPQMLVFPPTPPDQRQQLQSIFSPMAALANAFLAVAAVSGTVLIGHSLSKIRWPLQFSLRTCLFAAAVTAPLVALLRFECSADAVVHWITVDVERYYPLGMLPLWLAIPRALGIAGAIYLAWSLALKLLRMLSERFWGTSSKTRGVI